MPFYPPGFGLGEGGGFALIEPSGTFNAATQAAGETARNTYASNNASWLAELDANPWLLVRVTWPTTPTNEAFYGRANSSWVNLTALISREGPAGPAGPHGRQGIWWAQVWQAASSVPTAPTTYSIAQSGAITNLDNDWLAAPPATVEDGEAVYTVLALVNPASVTFPVTSGLTWSAVVRLTGPQGPAGPAGSGGGGGFDFGGLPRLSNPVLGDDVAIRRASDGNVYRTSLTVLRTLMRRTAAQLRTAIGNATSSVAGLMSAAQFTKLEGIEAGAEVNSKATLTFASTLSTNPPSHEGAEIVLYDGTPSDDTDVGQNVSLGDIDHIRLSLPQAAWNTNPNLPDVLSTAVQLAPLIDGAIASGSGVLLSFSGNSVGSNPALSGPAAVYAKTVSLVEIPAVVGVDAYNVVQLTDLTWGETVTTPDHGSTVVNFDLRLAAPIVADEVSGLADVATSGAYADLSGKPTFPDATEAEIAYEGVWDESATRTFISSAVSETTGEARYTEPTGVSQDRELYVDFEDADGRDREGWVKGVGVGKWWRVTKGSNMMLFKVEATLDTALGRAFLFTAANARFSPNEAAWPSDASLTGVATFETTDLDLAIYAKTTLDNLDTIASSGKTTLRTALPTGTSQTDTTISGITKILLADFDDLSISNFVTWHDEHHVGEDTLLGYTYSTTAVGANSDDGRVNDDGTNINIKQSDATKKAALQQKLINGKRLRLRVSDTRYVQYTLSANGQDLQNVLSYPYTNKVTVGIALTNDLSISLRVRGNIPTYDDFTSTSYKENVPSFPAWQYARTTGSGDTVFEQPVSDLSGIANSEKRHPTAGGVKMYVDRNGATLPSSPTVGQTFVLTATDGSNTAGLYFCRTAGTWEKA